MFLVLHPFRQDDIICQCLLKLSEITFKITGKIIHMMFPDLPPLWWMFVYVQGQNDFVSVEILWFRSKAPNFSRLGNLCQENFGLNKATVTPRKWETNCNHLCQSQTLDLHPSNLSNDNIIVTAAFALKGIWTNNSIVFNGRTVSLLKRTLIPGGGYSPG